MRGGGEEGHVGKASTCFIALSYDCCITVQANPITPLTFITKPPRTISPYQCGRSTSSVSSPFHTELVCECIWHDGRRGDAYDPLRRRKNKQKRNEEKEEERRRGRNNKNSTEVFPCCSSCFPMERSGLAYTACYNRRNESGGIWN